jgi:hypothetical protein
VDEERRKRFGIEGVTWEIYAAIRVDVKPCRGETKVALRFANLDHPAASAHLRALVRMTHILLPATDPRDPTFGQAPERLPTGEATFRVRFERQVWYAPEQRRAAMEQIVRGDPPRPWVLVGFSKSGLGAINLAIEHPSSFAAVVVFDAPLAMRGPPPWDSGEFYSQAEWERDLPINRLAEIRRMLRLTRLRHVAGANFHEQHARFHAELAERSAAYEFVSEPALVHHWASGWVEKHCDLLGGPSRSEGERR